MKLINDLKNQTQDQSQYIKRQQKNLKSKLLIENKDTIRGYSTRLNIKARNIVILFLIISLTITAIGNGFRWLTFTFEMLTQPIENVLPWEPIPFANHWWLDGWNAIRQVVYKFGGIAFMWAGTPIILYNLIMIGKIKRKWERFEDIYIPILNEEHSMSEKNFTQEEDILPFMSVLIHKTLNKFLMDNEVHRYLLENPRGLFKKFRMWRRNRNFSHYKISMELEKYYKRTFLIQDRKITKQGEDNANQNITK